MDCRQLRLHDLNVATSVEVVDHTDVKCYTKDIAWYRFDLDDAFTVDSAGKRTATLKAQRNLLLEFVWYEVDFEPTYN